MSNPGQGALFNPGSNQHDRVAVARHRGVVGQQAQRLHEGLRHQQPVEGVGVMGGQALDGCRMLRLDGQQAKPT